MAMNPRLLRPRARQQAAPCTYPASLLLHFDGNFTDSSENGLTVTAVGDAATTTAQSKFGGSSLNPDGGWADVTYDPVLDFGTGDFTIEIWIRPDDLTYRFLLGANVNASAYLMLAINPTGAGQVWMGRSGVNWPLQFSGHSLAANEWAHLAIVRSGSANRLFIDGVQVGDTIIDSTDWACDPSGLRVGSQEGGTVWQGYIDDLRITKGLAVYDCTFSPPAAPLSACVTPVPTSREASLLLHFDGNFDDSSVNALTATANGGAAISTSVKKFGSGSLALDGIGDYLTVAYSAALVMGSSDFAIEFWIKPTNTVSGEIQIIYDGRYDFGELVPTIYIDSDGTLQYYTAGANVISAGGALTDSVWQHVAVSRTSGTTRMFVDGTQVGSSFADATEYVSNDVGIGAYIGAGGPGSHLQGYIDDLRITKGLAIYKGPFTPPTAPLTAVATPVPVNASLCLNFDGNFNDESVNALTVTANGGAATSSAEKKFGSGSLALDGVNDYVTAAGIDFNAASGDWTVEAWIWPNALDATFPIVVGVPRNFYYEYVYQGGDLLLIVGDGSANPILETRTGLTPAAQTWWHVALVKHGTTYTAYENGLAVATTTTALANVELDDVLIGAEATISPPVFAEGYIDGLRITKAALYCDEFTPPTAPPTPTAVPPCCPASAPSCPAYGTYIRSECQGLDYGDVYADGNCGEYFEVTSYGGCE